MNKAFWLLMTLGVSVAALMIINLVQDYTSRKEADFYLLRDTTEAAMIDALDLAYYRVHGDFKIDKDIFVESFTRRFSESVKTTKNYKISFYDLEELPPKVSIKLETTTAASFNGDNFSPNSELSGILETSFDCVGIFSYDGNRVGCE